MAFSASKIMGKKMLIMLPAINRAREEEFQNEIKDFLTQMGIHQYHVFPWRDPDHFEDHVAVFIDEVGDSELSIIKLRFS